MVNIRQKRKCAEHDCEVFPSFNFLGEQFGERCFKHKQVGMVNVRNKLCAEETCRKRPSFNFREDTTPIYCGDHCKEGMVNVIKPTCQHDKCSIIASYGFPLHTATKCHEHREVGQIPNPRKRCIVENCKELATFGIISREHCEEHVDEDEVNLFEQECKSCHIKMILSQQGVCEFCDPKAFENNRLAKQRAVKAYLEAHGQDIELYDRTVDHGACSLSRPDFIINGLYQKIHIEVDEFQHKDRPAQCEEVREKNLAQELGMPTITIRWNPDEYKVDKGCKPLGTNERLRHLLEWIEFFKTEEPTAYHRRIKLYFDGYQKGNDTIEIIQPFES